MSKGRKCKDEYRKEHPLRHCVEGRCMNPLRKGFEWAPCRIFMKNIREGKTPSNCYYYKHYS